MEDKSFGLRKIVWSLFYSRDWSTQRKKGKDKKQTEVTS